MSKLSAMVMKVRRRSCRVRHVASDYLPCGVHRAARGELSRLGGVWAFNRAQALYATQHGFGSSAHYRTSGCRDTGVLVSHGMGVGLGRAHSLEYLCSHGVHRSPQPFRIADDVARGNVATEPVV